MTVLAFGEVLWDLLPSGKVIGGASGNFAFRLQRLGVPTYVVSRVGTDPLGDELVRQYAALGLSTELIQHDTQNPTGTVDVQIDSKGNGSYFITESVAYDFIAPTPDLMRAYSEASVICYGTLIQRNSTSRDTLYALLENGEEKTKILDINLRNKCWSKETVLTSLAYANLLKINDDEVKVINELLEINAPRLHEFAVRIAAQFDIASCLITRGAQGVFGYSREDNQVVDLPGIEVSVVDTLGCGDAFTAGFVSKYLQNFSFRECCEFGNQVGAKVAQTAGGMSVI